MATRVEKGWKFITHAQWESDSMELLREEQDLLDRGFTVKEMLVGRKNSLILARVKLPVEVYQHDSSADELPVEGYLSDFSDDKVYITKQILHDGPVLRACRMPQNGHIIASKPFGKGVYIFNCSKHPARPLDDAFKPDLKLRGNSLQGWGLSWNLFEEGYLLNSDGADIRLCNINASNENINTMGIYKINEGTVRDLSWHKKHKHVFGSAGEDHYLHIWDQRMTTPAQSVKHYSEVTCLAFNPFNEWILSTGSNDNTIKIFDTRRISMALNTLRYHKESVTQVEWSPNKENILASRCQGGRLLLYGTEDMKHQLVWDLMDDVSRFVWDESDWCIAASVSGDKIVNIRQISEKRCFDTADVKEPVNYLPFNQPQDGMSRLPDGVLDDILGRVDAFSRGRLVLVGRAWCHLFRYHPYVVQSRLFYMHPTQQGKLVASIQQERDLATFLWEKLLYDDETLLRYQRRFVATPNLKWSSFDEVPGVYNHIQELAALRTVHPSTVMTWTKKQISILTAKPYTKPPPLHKDHELLK